MATGGLELSRAFFHETVEPIVRRRWPEIACGAARLGSGSDVVGFDDEMSHDHDWGLRLNLFVPVQLVGEVDAHLADHLPESHAGLPVRFATTWDPEVRHRVEVTTPRDFARSRLGVDVGRELTLEAWLSLTGQAVLEVTAGAVFADDTGELDGIRRRLEWYPDDLWRHLVATSWTRLAQELPFIGRAGERGDDLGSRVVAARLVGVAMHLAHLLERRWPPYAKWLGTSLARLPRGAAALEPLTACLDAGEWRTREAHLADALTLLSRLQRDAGLPAVEDPVEAFWERPFRGIADDAIRVLERTITDPAVLALPRGVGSAEQWSDNVDVLTDPRRRRPPGP